MIRRRKLCLLQKADSTWSSREEASLSSLLKTFLTPREASSSDDVLLRELLRKMTFVEGVLETRQSEKTQLSSRLFSSLLFSLRRVFACVWGVFRRCESQSRLLPERKRKSFFAWPRKTRSPWGLFAAPFFSLKSVVCAKEAGPSPSHSKTPPALRAESAEGGVRGSKSEQGGGVSRPSTKRVASGCVSASQPGVSRAAAASRRSLLLKSALVASCLQRSRKGLLKIFSSFQDKGALTQKGWAAFSLWLNVAPAAEMAKFFKQCKKAKRPSLPSPRLQFLGRQRPRGRREPLCCPVQSPGLRLTSRDFRKPS